jgi:hypothetical protein
MNTLENYIALIRQVILSLVQSPLLTETQTKFGDDRFSNAEYSAYEKDGKTVHAIRATHNGEKWVVYANTEDRWNAVCKSFAYRSQVMVNGQAVKLPLPNYGDEACMAEFINAFNAVINSHGKGFRASARDEDGTLWLDFPEAQDMKLDENIVVGMTDYSSMIANNGQSPSPSPETVSQPAQQPNPVPAPAQEANAGMFA